MKEPARVTVTPGADDGMATATSGLSRALRGTAVYAVANALQRGIVFLLLPVFTRVLGPAEYGRLSVLLAIGAAANILLAFGLDTAFFRTYFKLRNDSLAQRQFVAAAWLFLLIAPLFLVGIAVGAAVLFVPASGSITPGLLALALTGSAVFVGATVVPLAQLRAQERLADYVKMATLTSGATAGMAVFVVVVLQGGVAGWLVAMILANGISLCGAAVILPLDLKSGVDRRSLFEALRLGSPLIPHQLAHWVLGISSRLLLVGMVSATSLGIYAAAGNIALPLAILMQSAAQGFMPAYARAGVDSHSRDQLGRVIHAHFTIVLMLTSLGMFFLPVIACILVPEEFSSVSQLVPYLVVGYGFLGWYFIPMNVVSLTIGRTRRVWMVTVVAAAISMSAVLALTPRLGLTGAALSSPIGYGALLLGLFLFSVAYDNSIKFEWTRMLSATAIMATAYAGAAVTSGTDVADLIVRTLWCIAGLTGLAIAGAVEWPPRLKQWRSGIGAGRA